MTAGGIRLDRNYEGLNGFFYDGSARWISLGEVAQAGKANGYGLWTQPGEIYDSWLSNFYPLSANLNIWARKFAAP